MYIYIYIPKNKTVDDNDIPNARFVYNIKNWFKYIHIYIHIYIYIYIFQKTRQLTTTIYRTRGSWPRRARSMLTCCSSLADLSILL
jgi:hypothetical protein